MGRGYAEEGDFFALLSTLREFRAGPLGGDPSDRALARAAKVSPTTVGNWLSGVQFPQDLYKFLSVVRAVAARAGARGSFGASQEVTGLLDEEVWQAAYRREATRRADAVAVGVEGAQATRALAPSAAGRLLTEMSDPFALEVHRPVQPEDAGAELPVLPGYVSRNHDRQLAEVVEAAAQGSSEIAVLVGGSSTGKTRACWEALGLLRGLPKKWRLWHPIDPSRPEATLRELPSIGPHTVVWLNEAQFYLEAPDTGVGERVAAGLRELLRTPARSPVLVLATLWPQFWDTLTARPSAGEEDPHAQARELLSGWDISVPGAFTSAQMQQITGSADPRLALAAVAAQDGQVIQFLAGAPELLARYDYAPPAAKALISAAIDARRLGMRVALPLGFLAAAASGYLTESEWDGLGDDWLEQALAYTAAECKGTRGPLTRIRPRPSRSAVAAASSPAYRLADYLDQHGRRSRRSLEPPPEFWAAATDLTDPSDLGALAQAAEGRGLLHDSARLHKVAVAHARPSASNPVNDAIAHAGLNDPYTFARLLDSLRRAGAADQVAILLARDPATHAPLDDSYAVARLLDSLRGAGAADQIAILLARDPAAYAALDNPYAFARLLDSLRSAGASDQAESLLARDPASHTALENPYVIARLLNALRGAGAADQIAVLLARDPAAHAALDNPEAIARLLYALRGVGAADQVAVLLARDPAANAALDGPYAISQLMHALRAVGAADQAAVLAARAVARAPLDSPYATGLLLNALRAVGAADQAAVLAARAVARAPLDIPDAVAHLLYALRGVGAVEQIAALLARDPARHAPLDKPYAIAQLLYALWAVGAADQVAVLADRAAAQAPLDNPDAVAWLLNALRGAHAADQVAVLLARDPAAHVALDNPNAIVQLMFALRGVGAADQVAVLLARDPAAHAALDDPYAITRLLRALRGVGAADQAVVLAARGAAHAPLYNPGAVVRLMNALQTAGIVDQAEVLKNRLAAEKPGWLLARATTGYGFPQPSRRSRRRRRRRQ
jgi:hypothetical protein